MFFDDPAQTPAIAQSTSCAIFVLDPDVKLTLKHPLYLRPDYGAKTLTKSITVDQIRDFCALASNKETADRFFIIAPADAMNEAAQNAFLKTFEEPKPFCHFLLLTEHPSALLPTILSRAQIFFLRQPGQLTSPPQADPKVLQQAKQLIAAQPADLPKIATNLAKAKSKPREQALEITAAAIELLHKSYFKTGNPKFLTKLPKFLILYENLKNNAHIKLHLVADLL